MELRWAHKEARLHIQLAGSLFLVPPSTIIRAPSSRISASLIMKTFTASLALIVATVACASAAALDAQATAAPVVSTR